MTGDYLLKKKHQTNIFQEQISNDKRLELTMPRRETGVPRKFVNKNHSNNDRTEPDSVKKTVTLRATPQEIH